MYKLYIFFIIAGTLVAGWAEAKEEETMEIYTFKRERVDQELTGNRGYLTGKAPEGEMKPRKTQRTLIGVDIRLGTIKDTEEEITKKQPGQAAAKENVVIVEKKEDEWIK